MDYKKKFYEAGEKMGIKINDLQRLRLIVVEEKVNNNRKYTKQELKKAIDYGICVVCGKYHLHITKKDRDKYLQSFIDFINGKPKIKDE